MFILGFMLIAAALVIFIYRMNEEASARNEYDSIREKFFNVTLIVPIIPADTEEPCAEGMDNIPEEDAFDFQEIQQNAMADLFEINNDFVGWISIAGIIEYPIVRGTNNTRYLSTTFMGHRNSAGAIFMDYRNVMNFDDTICIIYGHLTRDRTMFSELHRYHDPLFLLENPYIVIRTAESETLIYEVFDVMATDVWNDAYSLSYDVIKGFKNVPFGATRFPLLSTCTSNPNDEERLIVFAALAE